MLRYILGHPRIYGNWSLRVYSQLPCLRGGFGCGSAALCPLRLNFKYFWLGSLIRSRSQSTRLWIENNNKERMCGPGNGPHILLDHWGGRCAGGCVVGGAG